jgi:hypothetical protein
VTRDEWDNGSDPLEMVNAVAGRLTDRQLRLLLIACCGRLRHFPLLPRVREAAEVAERFADRACSQQELERAAQAAREEVDAADRGGRRAGLSMADRAVLEACLPPGSLGVPFGSFVGRYRRGSYRVMRGIDAAATALAHHAAAGEGDHGDNFEPALTGVRVEQCRLVREVVGDPLQPAEVHPSWLAWNGGIVRSLAVSAYEDRPFPGGHLNPARLAILADALEEAGCTDAAVLGHLRGPGPHARGCWVLDKLLARE